MSGVRVFSSLAKCLQSFKGWRFPSVREGPTRRLLLWPPMSWERTGVRVRPGTGWEKFHRYPLKRNCSENDVNVPPSLPFALSLSLSLPGSVGPLHSDRQYDISANKEGFVLSPVEGTQGDFKAFALAGVTFMVHSAVRVESAGQIVSLKRLFNRYPPPLADQVRGRAPPRRCPPVSKRSTVSLQPADPGHRSAHLQQPGRHRQAAPSPRFHTGTE